MAKEEQNAPGFYYVVKWRRQNVTSQHFEERVIDKGTNELRIEEQPIFEAYEIYVLAKNQVGEAVSPPRMVIGYSSEDGRILFLYFLLCLVHKFNLQHSIASSADEGITT